LLKIHYPLFDNTDIKIVCDAGYLNSMGVAMPFASKIMGALTRDSSNAIAIPQRNTVTPVQKHSLKQTIFLHIIYIG